MIIIINLFSWVKIIKFDNSVAAATVRRTLPVYEPNSTSNL